VPRLLGFTYGVISIVSSAAIVICAQNHPKKLSASFVDFGQHQSIERTINQNIGVLMFL